MHYPEAAYVSNSKASSTKQAHTVAAITATSTDKKIKKKDKKNKKTQATTVAAVDQTAANPSVNSAVQSRPAVTTPHPPRPSGAVPKQPSTDSSEQASTFKGKCSICESEGHRGRDCPDRNERVICYSCGKLDVSASRCLNDYCVRRRERWGNGLVEGKSNPSLLHQ